MIEKVISGGQTGVDRLGLEVAKVLGIPTGGTAPKGFKTEKGTDLTLRDFGLVESRHVGYIARTEQNVLDADATVIYGDPTSSGSKLTIQFLKKSGKPYIINPDIQQFVEFMVLNNVKVLNVAGNRESVLGTLKSIEVRGTFLSSMMQLKKVTEQHGEKR